MLTSICRATLSGLFISSLPASSRQSVLAALFNSYVFPPPWPPGGLKPSPSIPIGGGAGPRRFCTIGFFWSVRRTISWSLFRSKIGY